MADVDSYNPFQGTEIFVPARYHNAFKQYCQAAEGSRRGIDSSPFPRMVDMWFLAVCIAVRDELKPLEKGRKGKDVTEINRGEVFANEPDRVRTLMLIAIKVSKEIEIVTEPRRMIEIANGLAAAGLPKLIEMLKEGGGEPIWNLSEAIRKILTK